MQKICTSCNDLDIKNELFSKRYDHELDGAAAGTFDCKACACAYAEYKRVMDEVRNLPAPNVPIDFHARVMKAVRGEKETASRIRTGRITRWAGLAAACFILSVVVWLGAPGESAGEPAYGDNAGWITPEATVMQITAPVPMVGEVEWWFGALDAIDDVYYALPESDDTTVMRAHLGRNVGEINEDDDFVHAAEHLTLSIEYLDIEAIDFSSAWWPEVMEYTPQTTRGGWVAVGAGVLLIGGLIATLMAFMVYKKP